MPRPVTSARAWLAACLVVLTVMTAQAQVEDPAARAERAVDAIRAGRDGEARRLLGESITAIHDAPIETQADTWKAIGLAYLLLGELDRATAAYERLRDLAQARDSAADLAAAQLGRGRVALAAHDPGGAIPYLRQAVPGDPAAAEWLIAALMMQSRSPTDSWVEQAFDVAERARDPEAIAHAGITAGLPADELVIEYFVGDENAYGWVVSSDGVLGFELPAPSVIATQVTAVRDKIAGVDRDGLLRVSEDFVPALLGPDFEQLTRRHRIVFIAGGALAELPFAGLPISPDHYLVERVAVSVNTSASAVARANGRAVPASLKRLWPGAGDRVPRDYDAGISAGLAPDQALRIAQWQMIRAGDGPAAPKMWAAFQVAGEGRRPVSARPRLPLSGIALAVVLVAATAMLLRR